MALRLRNWLDRSKHGRSEKHWKNLSERAAKMRPGDLRDLREDALALRGDLDRFLIESNRRTAISQAELDALPLPGGTDWRWRPRFLSAQLIPSGIAAPENAERLGVSTSIWHDCAARALTLRQVQNRNSTDLAAFGMRLEILGFSGSFLSVAIDLPDECMDGLTRNHILRVETLIEIEDDIDIYARLNVGNGPNTEELLRHLGDTAPGRINRHVTEFDLAETEMNEERLDKVWLDLIFDKPQMNAVLIREMIVSRHPRANI